MYEASESLEANLASRAVYDEWPVRVWHLSDPHFGSGSVVGASTLASVFKGLEGHDQDTWGALGALTRAEPPPDFLVVSGDLSSLGTRPSLRLARARVLDLASDLSLDSSRVLVVPGNHDRFAGYWVPFLRQVTIAFEAVFDELCRPREVVLRGRKVLFYPFDSTEQGFRLWPLYGSTGIVRKAQFNAFNNALAGSKRGEYDVVVVVLHHHPLPVPDVAQEGLTVMKNGGAFMAHMQRHAVDLVLHGHMHRPYACRISYREESTDTVVSAAGTACQNGKGVCSVSVIELTAERRVAIRVFRASEAGFFVDTDASRTFRLAL